MNSWSTAKEHKLLEWMQQARLHSLGHSRAQETYSKKNTQILLPSIIFGALAVLMDGIALVWPENTAPFVISALIITAISTILDGILQATKPTEIASEHEDMAKGYNKIILQIDSMLAKDREERETGTLFLTKIEEELIALKTGGVKIPSGIWGLVRNEFLNGECDFQKIKNDVSHSIHPFRHTIKINPAPAIAATDDQDLPTVETVIDDPTVINIDPSAASLPTFELRIDNDPRTKRMEKLLYDFQMSRFG